jgi:hypothetical protein
MIYFQGSICLVGMRFYGHVPKSPRNKNLKSTNPYLLQRMVFWALKILLHSLGLREIFFSSTLNFTILQLVRNECVPFSGHVDIQVSYKTLYLKVSETARICLIRVAFKEGYFEAILDSMWPLIFWDYN